MLLLPWAVAASPRCSLLVLQGQTLPSLLRTLGSDELLRPAPQTTKHRRSPHAGHEPVCLVLAWAPATACALLEFAGAPTHILRVLHSVDIGITTTMSPALDIAALCLGSWPATISAQTLTLVSITVSQQHDSSSLCQPTADSCKMILRSCAWHCIMAQQFCDNHLTESDMLFHLWFQAIYQASLRFCLMGQTYIQSSCTTNLCYHAAQRHLRGMTFLAT